MWAFLETDKLNLEIMTKTNKEEVVPDEIGGARVLHFIKIANIFRSTGNTKHIVRGALMGSAYGLAICKYENQVGYYLFGCDENWESITDTFHETVEDAMEQGEFEYKGTMDNWISKHPATIDSKIKKESINHLDTAVFTTKFVLEENKTITYVTHDIEDGAWQFFSDDKFDNFESVAKVVGLSEIMDIDPTLMDLINMEAGYTATRKNKLDKWTIKRTD